MSPMCHKSFFLQLMHELHLYTNLRSNAQRIALSPCSQIHSHTFGNYVSLAWNVLGGAASIDPGLVHYFLSVFS